MTPEAALYSFFGSFGIPAYAATSTPSDAPFPRLTYNLVTGGWESGEVSIQVDVWYRTDSEALPNAKVREIGEAIGLGGLTLPCDGGILWVKRGSPWAQAVAAEDDEKIKRRYINVDVEYLLSE